MFAYIKGRLAAAATASVVLENGGIGYKIFISLNAYHELPQLGADLTLHTSFVVRELSQSLYGFLSAEERDFFELLMGVTGVGPKIALALIGHMPLSQLQESIANADAPMLCRVPGIGKKGAERLIIELRDKVAALKISKAGVHAYVDPRTGAVSDAQSALLSLGYNQATAQKAIKRALEQLPEAHDLSSLISMALKHV